MGDFYGYDALASGARRAFPLLPRLGPGGTAPFNPDAPVYSPPPAAPPPPAPVYTQPEQEESRALQEYLDRPAPAPGPAPPWWKQILGYATQFAGGPLRQTDLPQRLITGRGLRDEQEEARAAAHAQGQREALERRTELAGSAYDRGVEQQQETRHRAADMGQMIRGGWVPVEGADPERFELTTDTPYGRLGKLKEVPAPGTMANVSVEDAKSIGITPSPEEEKAGTVQVHRRLAEMNAQRKAIRYYSPGAGLGAYDPTTDQTRTPAEPTQRPLSAYQQQKLAIDRARLALSQQQAQDRANPNATRKQSALARFDADVGRAENNFEADVQGGKVSEEQAVATWQRAVDQALQSLRNEYAAIGEQLPTNVTPPSPPMVPGGEQTWGQWWSGEQPYVRPGTGTPAAPSPPPVAAPPPPDAPDAPTPTAASEPPAPVGDDPAEVGRQIKQQYPGSYDDMSDEELGQLYLARAALGVEQRYGRPPAAPPPPPEPTWERAMRATPILGSLIRSTEEAIAGGVEVARDPTKPRGYTRFIRGAAPAAIAGALPGLVRAAAAAPARFAGEMAAGIVGGQVAGNVARRGAAAAGASPEGQELAEITADFAFPAGTAVRGVRRGARMAEQVVRPTPAPSVVPPVAPPPTPVPRAAPAAPRGLEAMRGTTGGLAPEIPPPPPRRGAGTGALAEVSGGLTRDPLGLRGGRPPGRPVAPEPQPRRPAVPEPAAPPPDLRAKMPKKMNAALWATANETGRQHGLDRAGVKRLVRQVAEETTGKSDTRLLDRSEGQRVIGELTKRRGQPPSPPPPEAPPATPKPPPDQTVIEIPETFQAQFHALPKIRGLRLLGEPGQKMSQSLQRALDEGELSTMMRQTRLTRGGIGKLSNEEKFNVTDVLEGRAEPVSERAAQVAQAAREVYDEIAQDAMRARGGEPVQIMTSDGDTFNFRPMEDYTVHHVPRLEVLADKSHHITKDVLEGMVRRGDAPDLPTAETMLDEFVAYRQRQVDEPTATVRHLMERQNISKAEALDLLDRFRTGPRMIREGSLAYAREADVPFWDPNAARAIPAYVRGASRYLEHVRWLGPENERVRSLLDDIRNAEVRGPADAERVFRMAEDSVDHILGGARYAGESLSARLRALSTLARIGFRTAIPNMFQATLFGTLRTNAPAVYRGLRKALTRKQWGEAERGGATFETVLQQAMTEEDISTEAASRIGKWVQRSLKYQGFTASELFQRVISFGIGQARADQLMKQIRAGQVDDLLRAEMDDLGLNPHDVIPRIVQGGTLTEREALMAGKRMSDILNFRSRQADLPYAVRSPTHKLLWQFKNFAYNAAILQYDRIWGQFKAGNYGEALKNIATVALIFPVVGELVDDLRILTREGPEGVEKKWRENNLLQNWLRDAFQVGAYGMLADAIQAGGYGRLADWVVGPTLGTGVAFGEAGAKGFTEGDLRPFMREMLRSLPVLNNTLIPAMREETNAAVDEIQQSIRPTRQPTGLRRGRRRTQR